MKQCLIPFAAAIGLSGCANVSETAFWPWSWSEGPAQAAAPTYSASSVTSSGTEGAPPAPYAHSHLERGRAALAEGSPGRAESAFRKSLALEGESAMALTGLGVAYDQIGRPAAARVYLERAVAAEPDSAIARNNLGVHHWRNGDVELAIRHLERGAELAGDNEILTRNLELVATMRAEPFFDGGFDLKDEATSQAAFENSANGVHTRLVERQASEGRARGDGYSIVRSGPRRFTLQTAGVGNVTAPKKTRYHLYDTRIVPDGL